MLMVLWIDVGVKALGWQESMTVCLAIRGYHTRQAKRLDVRILYDQHGVGTE